MVSRPRPNNPKPNTGWRYRRFANDQSLHHSEARDILQPISPDAAQPLADRKHPIISSPTCRIAEPFGLTRNGVALQRQHRFFSKLD